MKFWIFGIGFAILTVGPVSVPLNRGDMSPMNTIDEDLVRARNCLVAFKVDEHVVTKADAHENIVVISAQGLGADDENATVRPGSIRFFRADASLDEFTKQGGWYWRHGEIKGKSQFAQPGALIMVVYQPDGTVHWYSLLREFRC